MGILLYARVVMYVTRIIKDRSLVGSVGFMFMFFLSVIVGLMIKDFLKFLVGKLVFNRYYILMFQFLEIEIVIYIRAA